MSKKYAHYCGIGETYPLPVSGDKIISAGIKSIGLDSGEVVAFPDNRKFVPSFDQSKSDYILIAAWASDDVEEEEKITLRGTINLQAKHVTFTGKGYKHVEVEYIVKEDNLWESLAIN
jgi:hypothetical protein